MRRFWLRPLSALQQLADRLFRLAPPCTCDFSRDLIDACGACHALDEAFEASKVRTGPLLRCRFIDVLPDEPS